MYIHITFIYLKEQSVREKAGDETFFFEVTSAVPMYPFCYLLEVPTRVPFLCYPIGAFVFA